MELKQKFNTVAHVVCSFSIKLFEVYILSVNRTNF